MKRLLIIGATVVALSSTAVVAWAGTGPVEDPGSPVATQTRGYDIDPIIMKILDRIQNVWHGQGHDAASQVADRAHQVADPMRDTVRESDVDVMRDAADQVRDRAHEVADRVRDAAHTQDMVRDSNTTQARDMAKGDRSDQGLDPVRHGAADQVANRARQVADPMRDATDQVRDRAHEVAEPVRDAAHTQDMVRDSDTTQAWDMAKGDRSEQGLDHTRDAVDGQNMDQGGNMDRSVGQGHMGGQGGMDR